MQTILYPGGPDPFASQYAALTALIDEVRAGQALIAMCHQRRAIGTRPIALMDK